MPTISQNEPYGRREGGQFNQSPGVHPGLQQAPAQVASVTAMNLKSYQSFTFIYALKKTMLKTFPL